MIVGETIEQLDAVFVIAKQKFKHVFWVPGNHELYTIESSSEASTRLRGEAKYTACVAAAKRHGVLTPEDEFAEWEYLDTETGELLRAIVCPIFTLYDYSFRPDSVASGKALEWAMEEGIQATDEMLLHPDPYATREEWCQSLVSQMKNKLAAAKAKGLPLIIVNHWPLREDLIFIPRVPRFSIWCGTKETNDWHVLFGAKVVVTGHLHVNRTDWLNGVRFEECSLGYPRQWKNARDAGQDVNSMLREILPGPKTPERGSEPPTDWRLWGIH